MINEHYVKKGRQDYRTPLDLAVDVRAAFGGQIHLDPCTTKDNHLRAERFYVAPGTDGIPVAQWDGLRLPWVDGTWCNPPYEAMYHWMLKCIGEASKGHRIGLLTSVARTEQACAQHAMRAASCIQFLDAKLEHVEGRPAMLASMVYWFNVHPDTVLSEVNRGIVVVSR